MKQKLTLILCLLAVAALCSCGNVSKSQARTILNESQVFNSWKPQMSSTPTAFVNSSCAALAQQEDVGEMMGMRIKLTDKGQQLVEGIDPASGEAGDDWCYLSWAKTGQKCDYRLNVKKEVSRISEMNDRGSSTEYVKFTYHYVDVPAEVSNCLGDLGDHYAKVELKKNGGAWEVDPNELHEAKAEE
jgi:hypothetical protein